MRRTSAWEIFIACSLAALFVFYAFGDLAGVREFAVFKPLLVWGVVAALLIPAFLRGMKVLRGGDGKALVIRLGGLVPFAFVGVVLWAVWWVRAFFQRRASIWGPVWIAGALIALFALRTAADNRQRDEREKELREMPEAQKTSGAASPADLDKWS